MDTGAMWARDWFSEAGGCIRDIWGSPWGWDTQWDMDGGRKVEEEGGSLWGRTWGDALKGHGSIMEGRVVMVVVVICDGQLLLLCHRPGHTVGRGRGRETTLGGTRVTLVMVGEGAETHRVNKRHRTHRDMDMGTHVDMETHRDMEHTGTQEHTWTQNTDM